MSHQEYTEEGVSKEPAIKVLEKLRYIRISPVEAKKMRRNHYNVLLKSILKQKLNELNSYTYRGEIYSFSEKNINQAISDLDEDLTDGLVKTNEKIYEMLLFGRSYTELLEDGTKRSFTLQFIDWKHPEHNDFYLVEEFYVEGMDGKHTARPDIVLFINGIPFGVIECKSAELSVDKGIEQMIRNQGKDYIPQLFKYVQIVMATNKNEVMYATCSTPRKYWSVWKEQDADWLEGQLNKAVKDRLPTMQDRNMLSL